MTDPVVQSIGLPPTETVEFFRAKGYLPETYRENWDGIWQEEHARWFTVTKLFNNQLLEEVRRSLDKVLSRGGTYEQWKAGILPKLSVTDKEGNLAEGMDPRLLTSNARLRVVYDMNLRMARAAGKWRRIQTLKAKAPYLMYDAVADGHTRPLHRIWGGIDTGRPVILRVDHPAWLIFFPLNGWGCRCGVIQLSDRDLKAMGLSLTTDAELIALGWPTEGGVPVVTERRYKRSTGEIVAVPAGIDPGFAYNPGETYLTALTPPPLTGGVLLPRIVKPQAERPPMPPPTQLPASMILPPDVTPDDVIREFMGAFGLPPDGEKVIFDPIEEPIAINSRMMMGVKGTPKTHKQGREQYPLLAARALLDPDEIWHVWVEESTAKAQKSGKSFASRLRRRYVARYAIDGIEQTVMVVTDIGPSGWEGRTWFQENQAGYMDREARIGTLVWRRGDTKKGPAS